MSYRYMRILLFFDLPINTSEEKREYSRFRKFLLRSGFVMMQESVYSKIILNNTACQAILENIRKNKTKKGLIQIITVTEKQFEKMEIVIGESQTTIIDNDNKLVII